MESRLVIFLVFSFICVILIIFLKLTLTDFNTRFTQHIEKNSIDELEKFSYDIYFNPPPSAIVITNPDTCNVETLKLCDTLDSFSCSGCQDLTSTCLHLDVETKYTDAAGVETLIPPNATPTEGYCLVRSNPKQLCNPFHGDIVFVQEEVGSDKIMVICECKNPGYIGKTTITGACDQVFICDGKVKDINVPFESIECVCDEKTTPATYNNTPVCLEKAVKDYEFSAEDFTIRNKDSVEITVYSKEIQSNYKGTHAINPCTYCLLTGAPMSNATLVSYTDANGDLAYQCALLNESKPGLPVRRSQLSRVLLGSEGADAVINIDINNLLIYGYISSPKFEDVIVGVNMDKNKAILERMNIFDELYDYITFNTINHQLVFPGSFGYGEFTEAISTIYCSAVPAPGPVGDFTFDCRWDRSVPENRKPPKDPYTKTWADSLKIRLNDPCPVPPHTFLASYKKWKLYESYNPIFRADDKYLVNNLRKLEISPLLRKDAEIRYVFLGIQYPENVAQGFLANDTNYYNAYRSNLIPKPDW